MSKFNKSDIKRNEFQLPRSGKSAGEGIGYPLQYSWASLVAQLVDRKSVV